MALEFVIETLGYDLNDNVIKRCRDKLDKVVRRNRPKDEIFAKVKAIISKA